MALGIALLALVLAVSAAAAGRLERTSITLPMVFVGAAYLLGPAVTGLLPLQPEAELAKEVTELTLGLLLFADASTLSLRQVEGDMKLPARLLLVGLPLTMLLGALGARLVFPGSSWALALLLATILAPTDAALGLPIFENPRVPVRIRRALNVESGLNDGIATPFVTMVLAFAVAEEGGAGGHWLQTALLEMGMGVIAGAAVGSLGARLLALARSRGWNEPRLVPLAVLGLAAVAFFGARAFGGNGFIAAFIGGIVFGARLPGDVSGSMELTEKLGTVMSLLVWTIFGATMVPLAFHFTTDWRPVAYAVLSLTAIRMVAVAVALSRTGLRRDTVALMGWLGPRGLASVVFTLLAFVELRSAGKLDETVVATCVWTILLSVVAHGVSAGPLASWYAGRLSSAAGDIPERTQLPAAVGPL